MWEYVTYPVPYPTTIEGGDMEESAIYTTVSVWDEIIGGWNELGEWSDHEDAERWLTSRKAHNADIGESERYRIQTVSTTYHNC